MVSLPKLTLTYFNFGGRGEPLRLAAAIGKVCIIDVYPSKAFEDPNKLNSQRARLSCRG
jgi:hypothetical protein